MAAVLRFTGGVRRDPAIERWFAGKPAVLQAIGQPWFERLRECGEDVRVLLHDGHPTACIGDAAFGYVNIFTAHVNVGFFQGASLQDPANLLEGTGRFMRHVKLRPGAVVDEAALKALVRGAYADMQGRLPKPADEAARGKASAANLARVRAICLSYPATSEKEAWGHPNFLVGKKAFVTLETHAGRPSIAIRLVPDQVKALCAEGEFFATPYGKGAWVSRYADMRLNWHLIRRLIDDSYRLWAP
jgi:predicted DNA-binding protein (MmcQ/YjbR family)